MFQSDNWIVTDIQEYTGPTQAKETQLGTNALYSARREMGEIDHSDLIQYRITLNY